MSVEKFEARVKELQKDIAKCEALLEDKTLPTPIRTHTQHIINARVAALEKLEATREIAAMAPEQRKKVAEKLETRLFEAGCEDDWTITASRASLSARAVHEPTRMEVHIRFQDKGVKVLVPTLVNEDALQDVIAGFLELAKVPKRTKASKK